MEMTTSICRKEGEDKQRTRKGKRKKVDLFAFLPDDILSDILKRLPDALLRYRAKYVCRRWLDIISNRNLLPRASFILQKIGDKTARQVGIREEGQGLQVRVEDLDIPRIGIIRSWGNEFLLLSLDYKGTERSLYVYNLITKEGSYLPKFNAPCGEYCIRKCGVAISFDGFNGIYKAVHLFMGPPIECHILILRANIASSKWKKIKVPCRNEWAELYHNHVSVQGRYIHWKANWGVNSHNRHLVSMDMVKEEIVDISLPLPTHRMNYTIFEMGGSLALFASDTKDKAEIWILKDVQRKKWDKLQSVTLEKWNHRRFLYGVMSNIYIIKECMFNWSMWYYDLKNGVLKKLDIHFDFTLLGYLCVVNSSPPSFR